MLKAAIIGCNTVTLDLQIYSRAFYSEGDHNKAQTRGHDYRVTFFVVVVGVVRLVCLFSSSFAFGLRANYATYPAIHPSPVGSAPR